MKKKWLILIGLLLIFSVIIFCIINRKMIASAEYSTEYAEIFGEFTAKTASEFLTEKEQNACYSPVSLFASLSLAAECIGENAQGEILNGINVTDMEQLEKIYLKMSEDVTNCNSSENIILCNSLWINKSYLSDKSEKIKDKCKENLSCEIIMRDSIEEKQVNEWIYEHTNGLVSNALENYDDNRLLLINTLYYKSQWKYKFDNNGKGNFYLENGEVVSSNYISRKIKDMRYMECEEYTIAEIPLQEGEMIFVLPQSELDLKEILSERNLNEILALVSKNDMDNVYAYVELPKFECESNWGNYIPKVLKNIGIDKIYNGDAWVICDRLEGSNVGIAQNATIKVDDKGIQAGSVSVMGPDVSITEQEKVEKEFVLNRPFMYVLIKNEVPQFIGTVYNPAE